MDTRLAFQLVAAAAIVLAAVAIARVVRARRGPDAPTQARWQLPSQIDRADFAAATPWLLVVFTSQTCSTCADVVAKAEVVASSEVSVEIASYQGEPEIHAKYDIDAVPAVVVADADGVVVASFIGPVTATDLWAAVADAREPGSIERGGCSGHEHP